MLNPAEFGDLFVRHAPWVLWVGSAVSVSAPTCIPLARHLLPVILSELEHTPEDRRFGERLRLARLTFEREQADIAARAPFASPSPRMSFEVVLQEISLHSGSFVPELLAELVPGKEQSRVNQDHRAVAALLRTGHVDLVVTTNFDECIEAATEEIDTDVLVPVAEEFKVVRNALLKLHGTISRHSTLAATASGVSQRAASAEWHRSLVRAVSGRNVLFVGYGFADALDITPALREAASAGGRFYWARPDVRAAPVPLVGIVKHVFGERSSSVLVALAKKYADFTVGDGDIGPWLGDEAQRSLAASAASSAARRTGLNTARRLASFGALLYWVEEGEESLALFRAARQLDTAEVDTHTIARALARSRRYRSAVTLFERMLQRELPEERRERVFAAVDWCMGAGWCARAGGRPGYGTRFYERAEHELRDAGIKPEELPPGLADQYFRSLAGQHIRFAEMALSQRARDKHLRAAEALLSRLAQVGHVDLRVRPLRELALAQIALLRGENATAIRLLGQAHSAMLIWADPHELAVCRRLMAIADPARHGHLLREEGQRAWFRGRRMEWVKIQLERLGFGRPGRFDSLRWWARNSLIALWDLAKVILQPVL